MAANDETLADRAWYALHCLPRAASNEPPQYRDLERAVSLSNGVISNIMLGKREQPAMATMVKLAKALRVSLEWLAEGKGPGPKLPANHGVVPPRLPYMIRKEAEPVSGASSRGEGVDEARAALEAAYHEHPNASAGELLAYAQIRVCQKDF